MKASEGEALIITVKEVLVILIVVVMEEVTVREVRIPTVVEAEVLTVAIVEAETLTVAVVDAVMAVTVPLETARIIRAITRWYRCPEPRKTAQDPDAAYLNVSPRRDHGLVFRIDNIEDVETTVKIFKYELCKNK